MKQTLLEKYNGRKAGMSSLDLDEDFQAVQAAYAKSRETIASKSLLQEKSSIANSTLAESKSLTDATAALFALFESVLPSFKEQHEKECLAEAFEIASGMITGKSTMLAESINTDEHKQLLSESVQAALPTFKNIFAEFKNSVADRSKEIEAGLVLTESASLSTEEEAIFILDKLTFNMTNIDSHTTLAESVVASIQKFEAEGKSLVSSVLRDAYESTVDESQVEFNSRLSSHDYLLV